jgi:hypothetical protein
MVRSQFRRGDRLCGSLGFHELCARNSWEPGILAKVWTLGKSREAGNRKDASHSRDASNRRNTSAILTRTLHHSPQASLCGQGRIFQCKQSKVQRLYVLCFFLFASFNMLGKQCVGIRQIQKINIHRNGEQMSSSIF